MEGEGWLMPSDYERLVKLEKARRDAVIAVAVTVMQLILTLVDIARKVAEELALKTDHDNNKLLTLCSTFSENVEVRVPVVRMYCRGVQSAQMLILEATRKHRYRPSEGTDIYREMHQVQNFSVKIDTIKQFLTEMHAQLHPTE